MLCRCSSYLKKTTNTLTLNVGVRGRKRVLLFAEVALFENNASTILLPIVALPRWLLTRYYIKRTSPEPPFFIAGSQTRFFLFKVRRAGVIKDKPQGIYWPPAQFGKKKIDGRSLFFFLALRARSRVLALLASSPMFLKRTRRKIKRLCTGYFFYRDWNQCAWTVCYPLSCFRLGSFAGTPGERYYLENFHPGSLHLNTGIPASRAGSVVI